LHCEYLMITKGCCMFAAFCYTQISIRGQQLLNIVSFKLDVRGSYNSYSEKPNNMQQCIKILLSPILNEAQHASGDTAPIIGSVELHKQPLVLHRWRVVGRAVVGRCLVAYTLPENIQQLHVRRPSTYAKPEAVCAVLGS